LAVGDSPKAAAAVGGGADFRGQSQRGHFAALAGTEL
jgi:hypothetical protein